MIILYGINKKLRYTVPLAIVLHGIVNLGAVLIMPNVLLAECWLFIVFIISNLYIIKVKKKFEEEKRKINNEILTV